MFYYCFVDSINCGNFAIYVCMVCNSAPIEAVCSLLFI